MLKSLFSEFKKFALRGNAVDLAVGVIIGASFGKIVDSLVKDILLPPLGLLLGKVDFSNLFVVLKTGKHQTDYNTLAQAAEDGAITLNLGLFFNALISFIIVAFAVFLLIKAINTLRDKLERGENNLEKAASKICPYCCSVIPEKAIKCPHCTSSLSNKKSPK